MGVGNFGIKIYGILQLNAGSWNIEGGGTGKPDQILSGCAGDVCKSIWEYVTMAVVVREPGVRKQPLKTFWNHAL